MVDMIREFHDLIYQASRNSYLVQIIYNLRKGYSVLEQFILSRAYKTDFDEHGKLMEAFRAI